MAAPSIPSYNAPNPNLDLTTVGNVQQWMANQGASSAGAASGDTPTIQLCITAASCEFTRRAGRFPNGAINTVTAPPAWAHGTITLGQQVTDTLGHVQTCVMVGASGATAPVWNDAGGTTADGAALWLDQGPPYVNPFILPQLYNESYDGNNNQELFLDQWPILAVQSLIISLVQIPMSTGYGVGGWGIHRDQRSLIIRQGTIYTPATFNLSAAATPFPPNTGWSFIKDYLNPLNVQVAYVAGFNGVPPDIEEAVNQMVTLNVKRRRWVDVKSRSVAGQNTTFRDWEFNPFILSTIEAYKVRK